MQLRNLKTSVTDRLVCTYKDILSLLLREDFTVNSLIEQTSSDRSHVMEALKKLEQGHLITRKKDNPNHKQKKTLRLTALGFELAKLLLDINQYNNAYTELKRTIRENFNMPYDTDRNSIRSKLRNLHWTSAEIDRNNDPIISYNHYAWSAYRSEEDCLNRFVDVLFLRYSLILREFNPKDVAKVILNSIIMDIMTKNVSHMLDHFNYDPSLPLLPDPDPSIVELLKKLNAPESERIPIRETLEDIIRSFSYHNNRFILDEQKKSFASIMKIPKETIQRCVRKEEKPSKFHLTDKRSSRRRNKISLKGKGLDDTLSFSEIRNNRIDLYEYLLRSMNYIKSA